MFELTKTSDFVIAPTLELLASRRLRRRHAHATSQPHHAALHETAHDRHVPAQEATGEPNARSIPDQGAFLDSMIEVALKLYLAFYFQGAIGCLFLVLSLISFHMKHGCT